MSVDRFPDPGKIFDDPSIAAAANAAQAALAALVQSLKDDVSRLGGKLSGASEEDEPDFQRFLSNALDYLDTVSGRAWAYDPVTGAPVQLPDDDPGFLNPGNIDDQGGGPPPGDGNSHAVDGGEKVDKSDDDDPAAPVSGEDTSAPVSDEDPGIPASDPNPMDDGSGWGSQGFPPGFRYVGPGVAAADDPEGGFSSPQGFPPGLHHINPYSIDPTGEDAGGSGGYSQGQAPPGVHRGPGVVMPNPEGGGPEGPAARVMRSATRGAALAALRSILAGGNNIG